MRKISCILLIVMALCSLAACGNENSGNVTAGDPTNNPTRRPSVMQPENAGESNPTPNPYILQTDSSATASDADNIDVDLTILSSTMVYSEVYNMLEAPDSYIGKKIKIKGSFGVSQMVVDGALQPDPVAYACVVMDATACCSQGLEFVLAGEHTYPDDYPALDSEITVVGTLQTYEDDGYVSCHLIDAKIEPSIE